MLNSLELTGRSDTHVLCWPDSQFTLHPSAGEALLAMRAAAETAGIDLTVISSFRDFERQSALWSAKFNGERRLLDRSGREIALETLDESALIDAILIWSALPGASRHHWGTDLDVVDAASITDGYRPQLEPHEFAPGGRFAPLDRWLQDNMSDFGFFRPYSTDRGGVQPEPWHLSYGPVSVPALQALSVEVLRQAISASSLPGRERILAKLPEIHARYVLAVDAP